MAKRKISVTELKDTDTIYKDGKEHRVQQIIFDESRKRYLITGANGYYGSIPQNGSVTVIR